MFERRWFPLAGGLLLAAILPPPACSAQAVRASQAGLVSQTVGTTEITVTYSRPVARGRELFGALIPWGRAWNPGANEATTVEFSGPVRVDGRPLEAGRYSVWAVPGQERWTVMLSRRWDVPHAPYPGEEHDALRVEIEPRSGSHMETLAFYFPVVGPRSTTMALHWGTTVVELPIEVGPS